MIPAVLGDCIDSTELEALRQPPQLNVSGVVKRSNKMSDASTNMATFDIDCSQWLNAFRHDQGLSRLPVRVFIGQNHRFKDPKKACPSKDTWVTVSGRLSRVEVDESTGWPSRLILDVGADRNVVFMGKWSPPFTPLRTPNGEYLNLTFSSN